MRILMVPAIIALLIEPANSQIKPTFPIGGDEPTDPAVEQYRKSVEQEYKATVNKIPDQKKKNNDPWQNVRSPEPAKKKAD
jgi:hypothetical protein